MGNKKKLFEIIEELEENAKTLAEELDQDFNNLEQCELWHFYDGYLTAIRDIKKLLMGD